jgi:hypothetical protein
MKPVITVITAIKGRWSKSIVRFMRFVTMLTIHIKPRLSYEKLLYSFIPTRNFFPSCSMAALPSATLFSAVFPFFCSTASSLYTKPQMFECSHANVKVEPINLLINMFGDTHILILETWILVSAILISELAIWIFTIPK